MHAHRRTFIMAAESGGIGTPLDFSRSCRRYRCSVLLPRRDLTIPLLSTHLCTRRRRGGGGMQGRVDAGYTMSYMAFSESLTRDTQNV